MASSLLRIIGTLVLAFALTSAVMFWLPILHPLREYYGYADLYEYFDTYSPHQYTESLKGVSPREKRARLDEITSVLGSKPDVRLFQMKAFDDVCANDLIDCRGLSSSKVKPFIDAILSERQRANAQTTHFISGGSLFV